MDIIFFESPDAFRSWLENHHDQESQLQIGFYKKGSGKTGITYAEALDQALCFGWIDGIRKRVDDQSYTIRFTPRKSGSIWSKVNIKRAKELVESGVMRSAGLEAFEKRDEQKANSYSYERENRALDDAYEQQFRANSTAWEFFQGQPPSYRKPAIWWVISAKKEETRQKRLDTLIEDSANRRKIAPLRRSGE